MSDRSPSTDAENHHFHTSASLEMMDLIHSSEEELRESSKHLNENYSKVILNHIISFALAEKGRYSEAVQSQLKAEK